MINEILNDVKHRMEQAIAHANMELNKVRTGRANPEMFDSLVVDYYGSMTPLNQFRIRMQKNLIQLHLLKS